MLLADFGEVMSYVGYVLLAILVLLIMITVHELGHYITGKIMGFKIEEFSIGFGPKLYKKTKKNGEVFSLRLIPLGGYCAFKGEEDDDTDPASFNNKKPWQRIIVLVSGALMNYILALVIALSMFGIYGQNSFKVTYINPDTAYSQSESLLAGDVIYGVEGKNVYLVTDISYALNGKRQGDSVTFNLIREGKKQDVAITLRADADFDNVEDIAPLYKTLGAFKLDDGGTVVGYGLGSTRVRFGFFETIGRTFEYTFKLAGTIFTVLGELLTGKLGLSSMGGTVTTITVAADAVRIGGFSYLLYIASFIGVNLAVFNLLPIPALDGSKVIFCVIEWIFKKPVNRKVEAVIHAVGFMLLLLFAIVVDVQHCF